MPQQGAYDGRWQAEVAASVTCQFTSRLTIDVIGKQLVGTATNPQGTFPLSGTVGSDGKGTFKIGDYSGTVDFTGNTFEASYANTCGGRHASGAKVGSA